MDERMVQDLLKEGLAFLKEQSMMDFIKNDQAYQESSEAHGKAEKQYIEIKSTLTERQREVVEDLLEATDRNNTDMNDLMYMTGMRDMYLLLRSYGMIKTPE
nr:hypothetical protein [Lachnoclostridium phocaeense]